MASIAVFKRPAENGLGDKAVARIEDRAFEEFEVCISNSGRGAAMLAASRLRKLATRFERLAQLPEEDIFKESVQDEINQWQKFK